MATNLLLPGNFVLKNGLEYNLTIMICKQNINSKNYKL